MADIEDRSAEVEGDPARAEGEPAEDPRKPYEPPRLTKKRSVARATLFTPMGPAMTGTTFMG
ncbi:hypothetical protein [Polyangium sp. y55x31]|uniref:hypothetical protein n=1 Tax=Polyangium sp. y55x31 TaxID=3042688 RepID=UPI0024823B95|nr:hypothetical protein [Polyangium sp. y55x31]MDI1483197.1 hypothetical protein [Polyangium sp. y55x31]